MGPGDDTTGFKRIGPLLLTEVWLTEGFDCEPLFQQLSTFSIHVQSAASPPPSPIAAEKRPAKPTVVLAKQDPKTESRDKWIYEQCCKGVPHDKIVIELKKQAVKKGWRVFSTKNRVWQIGKEYAARHSLPEPPPRQNK